MINLLSTSCFSFPKHIGRVNEDSILPPTRVADGYVFAVADGLGSYKGAKDASDLVISSLGKFKEFGSNTIDTLFHQMKEKVTQLSIDNEEFITAATTLTFCYVGKHGLNIGHIGDCRLYVCHGKKTRQLTIDDTQHQMLIDQKIFSARDLKDKPGKNILTTAISSRIDMEYDNLFIPYDELPIIDDVLTLYIMSDGAHHFWEKRPRFSESTMKNTSRFTAGLQRRIEKNGPVDDYSIVSISISIS
ncbi:PP2C family protein-serine/threonine phosphatase [Yersinia pseudotuberculosis]|uniref:PP2C family protein-serine/threonine phosphatase n=1 Tax=Yersinia pseudotuberculosis TaxID=633 RepID=UPI0004F8BC14|nr:protein phosphatase 2C domain-containing protein [Yersinia pseudotuberculosis]AIN15808.1 phosphatase 2C family protein [Yersinia pseudotuberculosis]MBO1561564.1 protein phosphatase [Yersinia pseudotuberculosis]